MKKNKQIIPIVGVIIVLLIAGGFLLMREYQEPEEISGEYDTFAACLYESGLRMYGSQTCSFCSRQRKLFLGSAEKIQEVECDPRNEDNQAELCIEKEISHTPTWILEDKDGNDLKRFEPGVLSLEELSEASGCQLQKD